MLKSNHGFISTPLKWESYVASLHLNPTSPKLSSEKYLTLMSPRMQCRQLFCLKYNWLEERIQEFRNLKIFSSQNANWASPSKSVQTSLELWVVTIAEHGLLFMRLKRLHQKKHVRITWQQNWTKSIYHIIKHCRLSSEMAEIHDQFDTILILDFGSQVFHSDRFNRRIDKLQQ